MIRWAQKLGKLTYGCLQLWARFHNSITYQLYKSFLSCWPWAGFIFAVIV